MLSNSTFRETRLRSFSSALASIDSTLNAGTTWARSGMWALASTACGSTALLKRPPSSSSSASQEEPQNSSSSWPVIRLVPPTHSATGPSLGFSPPTSS